MSLGAVRCVIGQRLCLYLLRCSSARVSAFAVLLPHLANRYPRGPLPASTEPCHTGGMGPKLGWQAATHPRDKEALPPAGSPQLQVINADLHLQRKYHHNSPGSQHTAYQWFPLSWIPSYCSVGAVFHWEVMERCCSGSRWHLPTPLWVVWAELPPSTLRQAGVRVSIPHPVAPRARDPCFPVQTPPLAPNRGLPAVSLGDSPADVRVSLESLC